MDENDDLGRYLQNKVRNKGIEDKEVANVLNISVRSVPKIYPLKDVYSDRLAKFCILLDENLFSDYYGQVEPLKSILNREKLGLEQEIARLNELNEEKARFIRYLKEEIESKNSSIENLQAQILDKANEILKTLNNK